MNIRLDSMTLQRRWQQGTVLVLVLVILLAMTLIGVTAMRGVTQGERMASNARQRMVAFQVAESALRQAEIDLKSIDNTEAIPPVCPPPPCDNGDPGLDNNCCSWYIDRLFDGPEKTGPIVGNCDVATYWSDGYCWKDERVVDCTTGLRDSCTSGSKVVANLNPPGRYVIEKLYEVSPSLNVSGSDPTTGWYRVTARGEGNNTDAVVVLQSIYNKDITR